MQQYLYILGRKLTLDNQPIFCYHCEVRKYVLTFAIWLTIVVLTIWLSVKDIPSTPENSEWIVNAEK